MSRKHTRATPLIVIKSEATDPDASEPAVREIIRALQYQITEHFQPAWGIGATIIYDEGDTYENVYRLNVVQTGTEEDQGFFGYHFSDGGYPVATIFAEEDLKGDKTISDTLSHEILEMLVDPACNLYAHRPADDGRPARGYFYEICDPVQSMKYDIFGHPVCDFVYPEWFEYMWEPASRPFDHLGALGEPFEILEGCYADIYERKPGRAGRFVTVWGPESEVNDRKKEKPRKRRRSNLRQRNRGDQH
ncbi:MAG TPA: hypothetical protein VGP08_23835 [Pyrinomonadaceae bacterium]|jgi:hypothetical protein|nr:hypothetical protein [Pyrinomonadaceae bacterium]